MLWDFRAWVMDVAVVEQEEGTEVQQAVTRRDARSNCLGTPLLSVPWGQGLGVNSAGGQRLAELPAPLEWAGQSFQKMARGGLSQEEPSEAPHVTAAGRELTCFIFLYQTRGLQMVTRKEFWICGLQNVLVPRDTCTWHFP